MHTQTCTHAYTCKHPHPCVLFLMSSGSRHLPTLPRSVMLQWWGKIRPMSCCENSRRRWWELSSPLSLCYAPLHSLTWEIRTGPGRGQQPACLMNTKQNLSLTGEVQKSSVFIYSFFSSRFFPPPLLFASSLFPPDGTQLYISPSWHHSEKREWDERNKTEPKCGNFSSFLYSHLSGFIVNSVCVNQSAPGGKPHTSTLHYIYMNHSVLY